MSVATASGLEEKQCQYWLLGSLHTTDIEDDDEDVIRATGGKFRMCVWDLFFFFASNIGNIVKWPPLLLLMVVFWLWFWVYFGASVCVCSNMNG